MSAQDPEARLARLGLALPEPPAPVAAYLPCVRSGPLLFVSGQIPLREGALLASGRLPDEVCVEAGIECARQCVLNALGVAKAELDTLGSIRRVVRVGVFVASMPGFHEQPRVADGASTLLVEAFGESGRHARAAVGSVSLPLGAPVEVECLFEVG